MSGENGKRLDDDLAGIDALIEAAAESEGAQPRPGAAQAEPEDERAPDLSEEVEETEAPDEFAAAFAAETFSAPPPPEPPPFRFPSEKPPATPAGDDVFEAAMAAVEAALTGDLEPFSQAAEHPAPSIAPPPASAGRPSGHAAAGPPPRRDAPSAEQILHGDGEFAKAVAQQKGGVQPDMIDGTLGRVEATLLFVESHPEHVYERSATSQVLREAAATIRLLREKRDQSWLQMERWFNQWRSSEAQSLDLQAQLKRLTGVNEQLTGLLLMTRSFCVKDRIFVEWRGNNAWVVRYEGYLLNRRGQWEADQEGEDLEPDYVSRTRYTLADAVTKARAVRLEGNG
ncbi:hypothetical protein GCM10007989_22910 [Devosia pacifica]|uniref:Uncharacterized protein n=1 Tax=Devosia pacifica TaxID=1335967 RepID=A0A918S673_9HYPH|nr:hypothetical protein [Devosia pacifica]GHA26533.1 hypothetical protein GCM10007989_22910 [Devosia pacifica]